MENILLSSAAVGGALFFVAFALCFALVIGIKLIDRREGTQKPCDKKTPPQTAEEKQPEAVYYIVERKRKAPKKGEYSAPKQFSFK